MSKLPLITVKSLEKLLFQLGYKDVRKEVMFSIAIHQENIRRCHIMVTRFWQDLYYVRF